jgi:hypothetical protein
MFLNCDTNEANQSARRFLNCDTNVANQLARRFLNFDTNVANQSARRFLNCDTNVANQSARVSGLFGLLLGRVTVLNKKCHVRFAVPTALLLRIHVFWHVRFRSNP